MSDVTRKIETVDDLDRMRIDYLCEMLGNDVDELRGVGLGRIVEIIREADAAAGLTTVRGFNTTVAPHEAVRETYPLVLYFGTKAGADELVALLQEAKPGMVAVKLDDSP